MSDPITNTVTLSATAEKEVDQDLLTIVFQAISEGEDGGQVYDDLVSDLNAALEKIRPLKNGKKLEVQTGSIQVSPNHQYNDEKKTHEMVGYKGHVSITVSGTDMKTIGDLPSLVSSMIGISQEYSVSHELRRKTEERLGVAAIKVFLDKASTYAKAFGSDGFALVTSNVQVGGGYRGASGGARPMSMSIGASLESVGAVAGETGKEMLRATVTGTIMLKSNLIIPSPTPTTA